tara:strand:- start:2915 stop:3604 length:690 start_codon:yes stop_codon:yes gene_type:complete
MRHYIDKKKSILFLFFILFFLSSINSQLFVKKKDSFYNIQSIKVVGLDSKINSEIEDNLNFLKNTNIFFIDKEILKDQISKYSFIENYNIFKLYPSKIILDVQQAKFLAQTIRNNKTFLIGSNGKFINIEKFNNYEDLPIVFGKFTVEKFINFKKKINSSDLNYNDIKEIFFFPSGRIDIKRVDNVLIKLPIENIEDSLKVVQEITNNKNFNNNIIDLRISNQVILSNE